MVEGDIPVLEPKNGPGSVFVSSSEGILLVDFVSPAREAIRVRLTPREACDLAFALIHHSMLSGQDPYEHRGRPN